MTLEVLRAPFLCDARLSIWSSSLISYSHPPTPAILSHPPNPPIASQPFSRDAPFTVLHLTGQSMSNSCRLHRPILQVRELLQSESANVQINIFPDVQA